MDDKTLNVIKGAQAANIQDEGLNKYFNEMNKIRKKGSRRYKQDKGSRDDGP